MIYDRTKLEPVIDKTLPNVKVFERSDDAFKTIRQAEKFCADQGFSVGRMCADEPMGIKRGEWDIQKWKNLDANDKKRLDGAILGEKRYGPVTVVWCDPEDR